MPTALDAGWYTLNGFHVRRQRQYVRATGLPLPSTWASAASRSGVMTAVECSRKSRPYRRQVSGGVFASAPLTGKNNSVGLRITWYPQFTADHSARMRTAPTRIRILSGAARIARSIRRRPRDMTISYYAPRASPRRDRAARPALGVEWRRWPTEGIVSKVTGIRAPSLAGESRRLPTLHRAAGCSPSA